MSRKVKLKSTSVSDSHEWLQHLDDIQHILLTDYVVALHYNKRNWLRPIAYLPKF